jgi:hypothetical protein
MTNQISSEEICALHDKLDRILALLEEMKAARPRRSTPNIPKEKPVPLTQAEITDLQRQFGELYSRWLEGHELEVQDELEKLEVQQLRRFADANNLNVTAKMPRQKVLQIIGARFREKRQLQRGTPSRSENSA